MRWQATVWIALAGCGRLHFDPLGTGEGSADGGAGAIPDAPPVAPQVCEVHQYPLGASFVPAHADLAATVANGLLTAMWLDADVATFPWGARIDTTSFVATVPPRQFTNLTPGTEVAALRDFGTAFEYELIAETGPEVDTLDETLSTSMVTALPTAAVPGRDSIARVNDTGQFVILDADVLLDMAPLDTGGTISTASSYGPGGGGTVGQVAGDDGPDHVHVGFRVDGGPLPSCMIGSVYFGSPTFLMLSTHYILAGTCNEVRVAATADDATDSLFGVWTQQANGELDAQMIDKVGTIDGPYVVSAAARAQRVRYDGSVFRLAWLDSETGRDVLSIDSYTPGGTFSAVGGMPDWAPAGDNGFTLVRDGSRVWLIIVSPGVLSVLGLCN